MRFLPRVALVLLCVAAAVSRSQAADSSAQPLTAPGLSPANEHLSFVITHDEVLNAPQSGRWELTGKTLELTFAGRVQPHENSVFALFGPAVDAVAGRFARVVLPPGWRYDIKYDEAARTVVVRNVRSNRAPAFPGAEGFGKYTLGGRGLGDDHRRGFQSLQDARKVIRTAKHDVEGVLVDVLRKAQQLVHLLPHAG